MPTPSYARFTYNDTTIQSDLKKCGEPNLFECLEYKHEIRGEHSVGLFLDFTWIEHHTPISITMEINRNIPLFYDLLCRSSIKYFDKIELLWTTFNEKKGEKIYFTHTIFPVKIRKVKLGYPNIKDALKERYTHLVSLDLRYRFLTVTYVEGTLQTGPHEWPLFLYEDGQGNPNIAPQDQDHLLTCPTDGDELHAWLNDDSIVSFDPADQMKEGKDEKQEQKVCELKAFTVGNSHAGRNVILDVLNGEPTRDGNYVLQVVSDYKKYDTVTISYDGTCDYKPNECPQLTIDGKIHPEKKYSLDCVYNKNQVKTNQTLGTFLKSILTLKHYYRPLKTYNISVKSCKASKNCIIEVFPYAKWEGAISMGYEYDKEKGSKGWKIKSKLKICEGTKSIEDSSLPSLSGDFFGATQDFLNKFLSKLYEIKAKSSADHLTITPPKIELSGAMELKESKNSYKVVRAGEIALSFAPFIGLKGTIDLLNYLLTVASTTPGAGGIVMVLKAANDAYKKKKGLKNVSGVEIKEEGTYGSVKVILKIEFVIEGTLNGSVKWSTTDGKKWTPDGMIDAKIELKVEGITEIASSFLFLKAGAGASIGGTTSMGVRVKPLDAGKLAFKPEFHFDGLYIYYSYYAEVGVKGDTKSKGRPTNQKASVDEIALKEEHKGKLEVICSFQFPKSNTEEKIVNLENGETA